MRLGGDSSTMGMADVQLALGSRTVTRRLRPVGLEFLETAPMRVMLQADVAASPTNLFSAITADPSTWTWFPIGVQGHLAGPGSPGVGSTREFGVLGVRFRETILACEPPTRWAYRGDVGSVPLVRALVELWTLEGRDGRTTVRWTLVADPRGPVGVVTALAAPFLRWLFRRAMSQLGDEVGRVAGETAT
jgi:hypothetical protein